MKKIVSSLATGIVTEVNLTAKELIEANFQQAAWATEQAALSATEYQRQRAAAYPPIGDQLDALWKGGNAAAEMLAQVQAVKAQYPKPE